MIKYTTSNVDNLLRRMSFESQYISTCWSDNFLLVLSKPAVTKQIIFMSHILTQYKNKL